MKILLLKIIMFMIISMIHELSLILYILMPRVSLKTNFPKIKDYFIAQPKIWYNCNNWNMNKNQISLVINIAN